MTDFRIERDGPTTLRLEGELDAATAPAFESAMHELSREGTVTIDLAGLAFIDSAGIRAIMAAARVDTRRLVFAAATRSVSQVLRITSIASLPNVDVV